MLRSTYITSADLGIDTEVEVAGHEHVLRFYRGVVRVEEVPDDFDIPEGEMVTLSLQEAMHQSV